MFIDTHGNYSIERIIPRDSNFNPSSMILQNVTPNNNTPYQHLFYLHYVNLISLLLISVHFQIRPLNSSLAYLFIYKFNQLPRLNSSINSIDGWTVFCPENINLTGENMYTYFINNQRTSGHSSIVFGLRELNSTEIINSC